MASSCHLTLCLQALTADNICKHFGPIRPELLSGWYRSKQFDTLMVLLKEFLEIFFWKSQQRTKNHAKLPSMQRGRGPCLKVNKAFKWALVGLMFYCLSQQPCLCQGGQLTWQNTLLLGWTKSKRLTSFVCLFDLILYVPVNNFSIMSGWVFLG